MMAIPIILKYRHGHRCDEYNIELDLASTGEMLKAQIFSLTKVAPDDQIIYIDGKPLQDDANMGAMALTPKQEIMMVAARKAEEERTEMPITTEPAEYNRPAVRPEETAYKNRSPARADPDYYTLKNKDSTVYWYNLFHSFRRPIDEYSRSALRTNGRAKVAILDSGIDMHHGGVTEAEKKRIKECRSFLSQVPDDAGDSDTHYHGTLVARLLLQQAPFADIYIARVKGDKDSSLCPKSITEAIEYAIYPWDVDIISMSWGFESKHSNIEDAIRKAFKKGKIMFVAASNTGANLPEETPITFPANMPEVICINSSDGYGEKSNFNPPRLPGHYNFSTLGEAVLESLQPETNQVTRKRESGTSFATPLAAAIAASFIELLRQPKWGKAKIDATLLEKVRTRDGILRILVAISRESGGFNYLLPWSLLKCRSWPKACPDRCRQAREIAGRKISKILDDALLPPADLETIADAPRLAHVAAADVRDRTNEYRPVCIDGTRADLLRRIEAWANGSYEQRICWLSGRLGTGKSTVARTVALQYADQGLLGGTFFFSKSEQDLKTLSKFVSSLAHQISQLSPSLRLTISKVKRDDNEIERKAVRTQWMQLIYNPLSLLNSRDLPIIIVIDALDECEGLDREKVMGIINLCICASALQNVSVRFLITSRPERHIQAAFEEFPEKVYQIALDEIDKSIVDLDISRLFRKELGSLRRETRGVEAHWPSDELISNLTERVNGLFVYAALICRYLRGLANNRASSIKERVGQIFQDQKAFSTLDDMYDHILTQAVTGEEKEKLTKQLKTILGVIVALLEPMPETSLCALCPEELELGVVCDRLDSLRSVLVVPDLVVPDLVVPDLVAPEIDKNAVYISHHSFREFLWSKLDGSRLAWINERARQDLFTTCIRLLSNKSKGGLRRDICGLNHPGTEIHQVDGKKLEGCIALHIRYACQHWVDHLKELSPSQRREIDLHDHGEVHEFLQIHLLHWLEALSLLGVAPEAVRMIQILGGMLDANESPQLYAFVKDAERFIVFNRATIEKTPLQVYYSALVFAPQQSLIRKQFEQEMPSWIARFPEVQPKWTSLRMTLGPVTKQTPTRDSNDKGHDYIAFSEDGEILVSVLGTGKLQVWDATTGVLLNSFPQDFGASFSPKSKLVASTSRKGIVDIFDAASGATVRSLGISPNEPNENTQICAVSFSSDSKQLAVGTKRGLIHLWDIESDKLLRTLDAFVAGSDQDEARNGHELTSPTYSSDNKLVVATSKTYHSYRSYFKVYVWSVDVGKILYMSESCDSYAFSPEYKLLVVISSEKAHVIDVVTGEVVYTIDKCAAAGFSSDGKLATVSYLVANPQLRDAATGALSGTTLCPTTGLFYARSVIFSRNGKLLMLVSRHKDRLLLWDTSTGEFCRLFTANHVDHTIAALSPDNTVIASGSEDGAVRIWDVATLVFTTTITLSATDMADRPHRSWIRGLAVSPDGTLVATSAMDEPITIWDARTGDPLRQSIDCEEVEVVFSPHSKMLVSRNVSGHLVCWDVTSLKKLHTLDPDSRVIAMAISPNSKMIAAACDDMIPPYRAYLYDAETGEELGKQLSSAGQFKAIAFSPDNRSIAMAAGSVVGVWDVTTGELRRVVNIGDHPPRALAFLTDDAKLLMKRKKPGCSPPHDIYELVELTTNTVLRELKDYEVVARWYSCSTRSGYISTNRGLLRITSEDLTVTDFNINSLFVGGSWVMNNGRKVLWLPSEYSSGNIAVKDNLVVFGLASGEVTFMEFNFF
ncbi:quinon protein alcohol dehydrogenase-like superfamily [Xylariaceae sp. FL1651]|nr:quinon protein alcohol dehydrogenase-like superfamily [Xylariaceae sp. FL1651]